MVNLLGRQKQLLKVNSFLVKSGLLREELKVQYRIYIIIRDVVVKCKSALITVGKYVGKPIMQNNLGLNPIRKIKRWVNYHL